jgi:hydrogenase maturation protease
MSDPGRLDAARRVLVLGIGNYLMGDEGVGVHAVRALEQLGLPQGATLVDGGTGGFHLLSFLQDYDPIVMIDATMDGKPAGSVSVVEPKYPKDYPKTLSAHDFGLKDLIESAAILGATPAVHLVTVSIAEMTPMHVDLSPPVQAAIPRVVQVVGDLVRELTGEGGGQVRTRP